MRDIIEWKSFWLTGVVETGKTYTIKLKPVERTTFSVIDALGWVSIFFFCGPLQFTIITNLQLESDI